MGSELKHLYAVQDNKWVKLSQYQSDEVEIWKEYYRSTIMSEEKEKKKIDGQYTDGEKNYTKINLDDNNSIYIFDSVLIYTDNTKIEYYVYVKLKENEFHLTKPFKPGDFKPGDFKPGDFKPGDTLPSIPYSNLYVLSNSIDKAKALIFFNKLKGGTKKPKPVAKPKKPKPVAKPKKPKPVAKPKKPKPVAKPKKPKPVAKPKKPKPVAKPKNISTKPYIAK